RVLRGAQIRLQVSLFTGESVRHGFSAQRYERKSTKEEKRGASLAFAVVGQTSFPSDNIVCTVRHTDSTSSTVTRILPSAIALSRHFSIHSTTALVFLPVPKRAMISLAALERSRLSLVSA